MKKLTRVLLCAALLLCLCTSALASGKVITTGNVNIRSGAGTNFPVIGYAPANSKLEYAGNSQKDSNDTRWYAVFGKDDVIGWVARTNCRLQENSYDNDDGTVTYVKATASTNLRSARDKDDPDNIVGSMAKGDKVEYLEQRKKDERGVYWYKVRTKKGKTAWVSEKYTVLVEVSGAPVVIADLGKTNVRKTADLSGKILTVLPKGETAEYLDETTVDERGVRWYKVSYQGHNGWVSYRYTTLSD